jgi:hypothetical protein
MSMETLITVLAVAALLAVGYWRFAGRSYGALRPSREATVAYESFRVDPGRNYYFSGPDLAPNAIMGIDKSLNVGPDLWKKLDPATQGIRRIVEGMNARALEHGATLHGFDILDGKGARIGDWFSIPGLHIVIRTGGGNRVLVSTPPLEIYPAG